MNVLEPILERHFHPHSYACRQGRGTHAAADRLQGLMQRRRYALQMDVRKFFPSLDHELLKGLFRRRVRDERVLWLMDRIVDTSNEQHGPMEWFAGDDLFTPCHRRRGLPIGNLTSQWFANWYLTPLDFFVTHELRLGDYVRYCDDLVVLSDDRDRLREAASQIGDFLAGWRLRVHPGKTAVTPVRAGLRFVGFRIWPTHRLLRKENIKAFRRRVRWIKAEYAAGRLDYVEDIRPRIASWLGHARQANSRMLIRRLSREWVFRRDPGISDEQK